MILNHSDSQINGIMRLVHDESSLKRNPFSDEGGIYTIAWNKGPLQRIQVDSSRVDLPENHAIVLDPGQAFSMERPCDVVAIQFNRDFYCIVDHDQEVSCTGLLFYGSKQLPIICLNHKEQSSHKLLFDVFLDEFHAEDDSLKTEMLRVLLKRLIVKLTRAYKEQADLATIENKDLDVVREFNLLVNLNFKKLHQVQDYADLLNKSPKTISNVFSKYGDRSPLEVIHQRLLLEAKRLLIYTDKTTKEIAYELGFQDIPGFSRFFKKNLQLAPSKYRESQKNLHQGKN